MDMNAFRIVAIVVSLLAWSVWLVAALHARGIHPIREVLSRWSRLGVFGKIAIALFFAHLAIYGSTKPSGTNGVDQVSGTNDVEIVEGGNTNEIGEAASPPLLMVGARPFTNGETPLPLTVPCYRLESISTNEGYSYAMPTDASVRGTWHIRGAYEDVMKVGLGDFRFPLGGDLCSLLWIHTWGKVRPQLHNAANEIAASGMSMSAVPGESRFWTVATTNGTYLLTWENFFLERDTNMPANAQIELSGSGDFVTRFNDLEATYSRVIPPNPITPINPPDPGFPSRSLHPFGAVQDLSVIEETNAYCWVDIVVDRADAWVNFRGDGISNLSDPSFAAAAGETNHVIILIGKTYGAPSKAWLNL